MQTADKTSCRCFSSLLESAIKRGPAGNKMAGYSGILPAISLKLRSIFGPMRRPESAALPSLFVHQLLREQRIEYTVV